MTIDSPTALLTTLTEKLRAPTPLLGTLATIAADGSPNARAVVLRYVDDEEPALYLSTHSGAHKVHELRANPRGTLVLWFPEEKIQLRFAATWSIIDARSHETDPTADDIRRMMWSIHSHDSQQMFSWPPPGQPTPASPLPEKKLPEDPTLPTAAFTILHGLITSIDALHITKPRHLRFQHTHTNTNWKSTAITP